MILGFRQEKLMRLWFFLIICGFGILGLALVSTNNQQRTTNDAT